MSVIAGVVGHSQTRAKIYCERMLRDLRPYASGQGRVVATNNIAIGQALEAAFPEDAFDAQPIRLPDGRLIVTDLRIDNRSEIESALGYSSGDLSQFADSWIFAESWQRWGELCLDRIFGDYSVAIWDDNCLRLTLARSLFGARPLFYSCTKDFTVFASMPRAICIVPEFELRIDEVALAADATRIPRPGSSTIYENIYRVLPGHIITISGHRAQNRCFWRPNLDPLPLSVSESASLLKDSLGSAVASRLRGSGKVVASQLSGGRDSSAVTVTAAMLLKRSDKRLIAFTGAPRCDFHIPSSDNEVFDESALAAQVLRPYPEVDHSIVRDGLPISSADLETLGSLNQFPVSIPSNLSWQIAILNAARLAGAKVLLSGQMGNSTISVGGLEFLPDLLEESGFSRWGREILRGPSRNPLSLLRRSSRSLMPRGLYARLANRSPDLTLAKLLLSPEAYDLVMERYGPLELQPQKSGRAELASALVNCDQSQVLTQALWGIDLRDPTADRRLAREGTCEGITRPARLRSSVCFGAATRSDLRDEEGTSRSGLVQPIHRCKR